MPPKARPCPVCKAPAAPREKNAAFPFCSAKCKLLDLGKWLDGKYVVAGGALDESGSSEDEK